MYIANCTVGLGFAYKMGTERCGYGVIGLNFLFGSVRNLSIPDFL